MDYPRKPTFLLTAAKSIPQEGHEVRRFVFLLKRSLLNSWPLWKLLAVVGSHSPARLKISDAFVPPNPNEFVIAQAISICRA